MCHSPTRASKTPCFVRVFVHSPTSHLRTLTACALVQPVYRDSRGSECAFCSHCGRLCKRDVYFKPGNTALCRLCSYLQRDARGHTSLEDSEHTDIVELIPRAPAGEPEMPQGQFPSALGWKDNGKNHPTCAVAGCDESVPKVGKLGKTHHKSRVCRTHMQAPCVWEVRCNCMYPKRWCYKCSAWKVVDRFVGQSRMCIGCRASATKLATKTSDAQHQQPGPPGRMRAKQSPDAGRDEGMLLHGSRPATAHSEWLLNRSHAGSADECQVLGCTAFRVHDKANVCTRHIDCTLFRECRNTEEPLVRYCKGCRVFKPATGYKPDGRCSDGCANRGDLGMRAKQLVCADAARVRLAVQQRANALPQDAFAVAKELGAGVLDDTREHGGTCRHMTAAQGTCHRAYKGHVSQMCPSHIPAVVVRLTDRAILWYCSGCRCMVDVTRMSEGRCATCEERAAAHVRALRAYQAAAACSDDAPRVPHDGGKPGVASLDKHPDADGEAAPVTPPLRARPSTAHSSDPSPGEARRGARAAGDDGSSTADDDDLGWGALDSPKRGAQVAVDGGAEDVTEATAHAACDGPSNETPRCRGGCNANISRGQALGGYCVVCMATVMRHACVLDLAVLATYPRCLVGGAGVCSVAVPRPFYRAGRPTWLHRSCGRHLAVVLPMTS